MDEGNSTENLSHAQLKIMHDKAKEANRGKYLENSRRRFDKILCTKIRTSFIGALDAFEKNFGFLWGHGKRDEDRTPEEKAMHDIWVKTRTEVLNNGNNQLRGARNEIANPTVRWNRYHLELPVKPLEEDDDNGNK
jgi:hypothetical protein